MIRVGFKPSPVVPVTPFQRLDHFSPTYDDGASAEGGTVDTGDHDEASVVFVKHFGPNPLRLNTVIPGYDQATLDFPNDFAQFETLNPGFAELRSYWKLPAAPGNGRERFSIFTYLRSDFLQTLPAMAGSSADAVASIDNSSFPPQFQHSRNSGSISASQC